MSDLTASLAALLENAVEDRCTAIREAAEGVISEFRALASRIASGDRTGASGVLATLVAENAPAAPTGPTSPLAALSEPAIPSFVRPMHYEVTDAGAAADNMRP